MIRQPNVVARANLHAAYHFFAVTHFGATCPAVAPTLVIQPGLRRGLCGPGSLIAVAVSLDVHAALLFIANSAGTAWCPLSPLLRKLSK